MKSIPDWLTHLPVAHRGLHDLAKGIPENSTAAFAAARARGYAVELDVRLSRDGVPVVFHDAELTRLTGRHGRLDSASAAELAELVLCGTDETVPTLEAVLSDLAPQTPVLIEVKNEGNVGAVEQAVADVIERTNAEIALQSFNAEGVAWFEGRLPGVPRGFLSSDSLAAVAACRPDFIGYNVRSLPSRALQRLRNDGLPVLAWTVTSPDEVRRARRYCDNIIFEGFLPQGGRRLEEQERRRGA